ncbi:hypothetical protein O6H91_05G119100 [Diphasiastrum complanatum]|uniref:Uncharacterized protein n=1 Tax=Diphasiastrum complanatum TaxID=34168 RepID=A0ACC2DSZ4_DIPCM|nr:hypothetical protein O6H91_05G119100 [Diphasiastrum complanatum]
MGRPLPPSSSSSSTSSSSSSASSSSASVAASSHDDISSCNGHSAPAHPQHLFVYGNLRPDINIHPVLSLRASLRPQKAWLLGGRLYSTHRDGVERAALRLEEFGHAVKGYVLSADDSRCLPGILEECEIREHPPSLYERDVVEVVTESGERMQSYVYHYQEVDRSNPVITGDWLQR